MCNRIVGVIRARSPVPGNNDFVRDSDVFGYHASLVAEISAGFDETVSVRFVAV